MKGQCFFPGLFWVLLLCLLPSPALAQSPGDLDSTFDGDGKVTTDFGGSGSSTQSIGALALQPDGKIVAAGTGYEDGSSHFALARYQADGSLDPTFDGNGKVTTGLNPYTNVAVRALALQPDGKILVAGAGDGDNSDTINFALIRYNADGSLDSSFGDEGKLIPGFDFFYLKTFILQPDGKIVVAGNPPYDSGTNDFTLVRYEANGSLDLTFGGDGKVTTDFGGTADVANALALQPDGKLVAAGVRYEPLALEPYKFALARYNPDGNLDPSFDGDG